jgi:YesN/AraC family two-component response regulator
MPGMNGRELLEHLKQERPEIKMVLMSGYTDNIIAQHGILESEIVFINKPLLPITLANTLRAVLDRPDEGKMRPGPPATVYAETQNPPSI